MRSLINEGESGGLLRDARKVVAHPLGTPVYSDYLTSTCEAMSHHPMTMKEAEFRVTLKHESVTEGI